jgi:hypothetical protein
VVSSLLCRERLFTFPETTPIIASGAYSGPSEAADFFSGIISLPAGALDPELLEFSVTVQTLLSSTFNITVLPPIE